MRVLRELLHFNPHPARWNSLRSLSVRTLSQRERVNRAAFTLAEQAEPAALVRHCEKGVSPTKQSRKSTVLTGLPRSLRSLAMTRREKAAIR
jgi:hypothetical protein